MKERSHTLPLREFYQQMFNDLKKKNSLKGDKINVKYVFNITIYDFSTVTFFI